MKRGIGLVLLCMSALAQAPVASDAEKHELAVAVEEANTSGFDMIRALEAHLRKYPNTPLRPEIFNLLAKAAVETRDDARIVKYGEPVLVAMPNDGTLLDRVARALLDAGGKDNATRALDYAKRFEGYVSRVPVVSGFDPVRNQEEHDRSLARALLYQVESIPDLGKCGRGAASGRRWLTLLILTRLRRGLGRRRWSCRESMTRRLRGWRMR